MLGFRLYERIVLDDGSEAGAWLSLTIAAHELIYVADARGARGGCTTSPSGSTRARRCLRAADLFLDNDVPIEAAPSKHAVAQGFFLYGFEPGGNRIEVTDRRLPRLRPRSRAHRLDRGRAGQGPGLGRQDRGELPHLRDLTAARR